MDFRDTPAEAALREDVRHWLRDNLPTGWGATVHEPDDEAARFAFRCFFRALHEMFAYRAWVNGWLLFGFSGISSPKGRAPLIIS